MCDRGFGEDGGAEVEGQPAHHVIRKHVIDRGIERRAAGNQRQGIEIALNGDAVLHALADQRRLGGPVDADGVDAGCFHIAGQQRTGASSAEISSRLMPAITTSRTNGAQAAMNRARSGPTLTQVPLASLKSSAMRPSKSNPALKSPGSAGFSASPNL